jgi:hypothetical protein
MRRHLTAATVFAAACLAGAAPASVDPAAGPAADTASFDTHSPVELRRFSSAAEFDAYFRERRERRLRAAASQAPGTLPGSATVVTGEELELSGATDVEQIINSLPQVMTETPEITNNQTVGVDEGGIVKQIGRFLIVLQDGRLFSIDLGEAEGAPLRLAGRIDVYRTAEKAASWYDEMLVAGNRILVTAYSYEEDASEISVFRLAEDGGMAREGRYLISSDDYYSTENYATRIIGDNLVFYAPLSEWRVLRDGEVSWPRLRRAPADGDPDAGQTLIGPTEVYAPLGELDESVLHTLSICPLRGEMDCRSTAFVAPEARELYVSPTDAFLWFGAPDGLPWSIDYANQRRLECREDEYADERSEEAALLYRVPLDGGDVGAVALDGIPDNQFAFDSRDGRLRALLERIDETCHEWGVPGRLALLDIPLSAFGRDVRRLSAASYTPLPSIEDGSLENRFVGQWLVYGGRTRWSGLDEAVEEGDGRRRPTASALWAVPLARPAAPVRVALPHNSLRIERAGQDAVVTGYAGEDGLSMSYVALGSAPRLTSTALLPGRFESEGRSHAFGAWLRRDGSGLIGIPTSRRERSGRGWSDSESSSLSYVAISPGRSLVAAGQLDPAARRAPNAYRCEVSCIDWYGNSRPIFTGGRIFALMGTDLVEGRFAGGRVAEIGRVDLTGRTTLAAGERSR